MTVVRIVLGCNGPADHPSPGGHHPTAGGGLIVAAPITDCLTEFTARCHTVERARLLAADEGWTSPLAKDGRRIDLCPKHSVSRASGT